MWERGEKRVLSYILEGCREQAACAFARPLTLLQSPSPTPLQMLIRATSSGGAPLALVFSVLSLLHVHLVGAAGGRETVKFH